MLKKIFPLTLFVFFASAQKPSQVATLKRQLADCKQNFTLQSKVVDENYVYQKQLLDRISKANDSLNSKSKQIELTRIEKTKLNSDLKALSNDMTLTKKTLSISADSLLLISYELEIEKNETKKIYNKSLEALKGGFLKSLNNEKNGFTFDENGDELKVSKSFGENTEAWWVFDKTIDSTLELILKFEVHKFDKSKSILTVYPKLLEKVRYSNKQFETQKDEDKINLYKNKCIKILETN